MLDETDGRESRLAKLRHMYAVKDMFDDETEAAIERAKRTVERSMYEPNSMLKERAEGMKDDLEEFHRDLRRNPVSTWIEEAEAVIAGLGGDDDPERLLKTVAELIQKLSTAPEELQDLATMADALWVRYKPSGAARLAADAVRDRTKLAGMYTRFLKSFQDSRRIGELRYRLHSITSVGFCTLVPNLRSSRALVDYEDLLRAMKQALQLMHHQVKALEMEVAFDGYWLESAQATALLSDLSDAHLMVCTQKLAQLQAMRRGWAERERATEIRAQAAASFASTAPKMVEENPGGREAPRKHSILDTVTKVITLGRTSTASGTQEGEAHEPSQQRKKSAEDIRDEVEQDFASSWRMNAVQDTSQLIAELRVLERAVGVLRSIPVKSKVCPAGVNSLPPPLTHSLQGFRVVQQELSSMRRERLAAKFEREGKGEDASKLNDAILAVLGLMEDYASTRTRLKETQRQLDAALRQGKGDAGSDAEA